MGYPRLLNIQGLTDWKHHRSGWKYAVKGMWSLHNLDGVWFDGFLDGFFVSKQIVEPWTGVFHNVPFHPDPVTEGNTKYAPQSELNALLYSANFQKSYPHCCSLFTVSSYIKEYLETRVQVPVSNLIHPSEEPDLYFSYEHFLANPHKKLITTGQWLRRYSTLFRILSDQYQKSILLCDLSQNWNTVYKEVGNDLFRQVTFLRSVGNAEYDILMSQNIVFLDLYDVAACNSIIDCIMRNTPIMVPRLKGAVEYLGEDYPFYFRDISDATNKIHNMSLIKETSQYLETLPIKKQMTLEYFLESMVNSEAYKALERCNNIVHK